MKHCILVKYQDVEGKKEKKELTEEIRVLFSGLLEIEGIRRVELRENIIDRPNRFDLLIRIDMTKEALPVYDASLIHRRWKEKYGELLEQKAIFDYEDE
jgi:hypothetical protein